MCITAIINHDFISFFAVQRHDLSLYSFWYLHLLQVYYLYYCIERNICGILLTMWPAHSWLDTSYPRIKEVMGIFFRLGFTTAEIVCITGMINHEFISSCMIFLVVLLSAQLGICSLQFSSIQFSFFFHFILFYSIPWVLL